MTAPGFVPLSEFFANGDKHIILNAIILENSSSSIPEISITEQSNTLAALKLRIDPMEYKLNISSGHSVRKNWLTFCFCKVKILGVWIVCI